MVTYGRDPWSRHIGSVETHDRKVVGSNPSIRHYMDRIVVPKY